VHISPQDSVLLAGFTHNRILRFKPVNKYLLMYLLTECGTLVKHRFTGVFKMYADELKNKSL